MNNFGQFGGNTFQPNAGSVYNPYTNQGNMLQRQGYLQQNPTPSFYGKVISNLNEVAPNEVPMDGSVSFFPMNDYSAIYAKAWNGNGSIVTVKYVRENTEEQNENSVELRLDRIEKLLKQNFKQYNKQNYKKPADKEAVSND